MDGIVQDNIKDIRNALEDETFENEEEVRDFIMDEINNQLTYHGDVYDIAQYYVDDDTIIDLFFDDYVGEVFSELDSLEYYVNDEEE